MIKRCIFISFLILNSCVDVASGDDIFDGNTTNEKHGTVSVMTYNVYIGMDVDRLFTATSPEETIQISTELYAQLQETDFNLRAYSIAKDISRKRPDVVSLQEITKVYSQSPSDYIQGGNLPANKLEYDYLIILFKALRDFGLDYRIAAKVKNTEVELPITSADSPNQFTDIRIVDYDVCLINSDFKVKNLLVGNYKTSLNLEDLGVEIRRGYIIFESTIHEKTYQFINTHLESDDQNIRISQNQELLSIIPNKGLTSLLMGDFNSQTKTGKVYNMLKSAGYKDSWLLSSNSAKDPGFTSLQDPDLKNTQSKLFERIDYIFIKNAQMKNVLSYTVGDTYMDKTVTGLWPSDHAGVFSSFKLSH